LAQNGFKKVVAGSNPVIPIFKKFTPAVFFSFWQKTAQKQRFDDFFPA
jgi:hypothetical protein